MKWCEWWCIWCQKAMHVCFLSCWSHKQCVFICKPSLCVCSCSCLRYPSHTLLFSDWSSLHVHYTTHISFTQCLGSADPTCPFAPTNSLCLSLNKWLTFEGFLTIAIMLNTVYTNHLPDLSMYWVCVCELVCYLNESVDSRLHWVFNASLKYIIYKVTFCNVFYCCNMPQ